PGQRPERQHPRQAHAVRAHAQREGPADPGRARRLRLSLPRRPVRHRGEPHRRAACARPRPLRVRDRQRSPDPPQYLLRLARRGDGRPGEDLQVQAVRPGPACRRARGMVLSLPAAHARMTTTYKRKPTKSELRRQQMETAIMYPVDWLEERSGLVGGLRYFLFRNVPADVNWMQTLGSAALTAFLVQAITGV